MARITVVEHVEWPVLPPDTIIGVKVAKYPSLKEVNSERGNWQKIEFEFQITSLPLDTHPEWEILLGSKIWGSVPFRLEDSPDNPLNQWASALLGLNELPLGFELDTDNLMGREAKAVVGNYDRRDGRKAHQVSALLVLRNPAQAHQANVAAHHPDEDIRRAAEALGLSQARIEPEPQPVGSDSLPF